MSPTRSDSQCLVCCHKQQKLILCIRSRYVILSGGYLITFKIKKKQAFHERKKVFSLFGSYCYSGQMAHDELHDQADQDAFARHPRVYHDGLQVCPTILIK